MSSADGRATSTNSEESQKVDELAEIIDNRTFASEILLAEYKMLRDEIVKKMDHRTSFVVCSITVSSAVLGFGIERRSGSLLLVSPLVSILLGILILFHNVQIGEASKHIRIRFEVPLATRYPGFIGWHSTKEDPKYRLKERFLPYHLPLVLIAVAPGVVAVPIAILEMDSTGITIPVLAVDGVLLGIYIFQMVRHRDSI